MITQCTLTDAVLADGVARIPEAMEFLKLSRSTLYGLMDRGELRYTQIGRSRRIPWAELKRFVQANTKGTGGADFI